MEELKELEELRKENQELKDENERISRINENLLRQIKERSNSEKGQFPKKRHHGYSLVKSFAKEYRFYKGGNHRIVWIFETVLQTPYDISLPYNDVLDIVSDDISKPDEDDLAILNKLGFGYCFDNRTYADYISEENINGIIEDFVEQYKEEYDTDYIPNEKMDILRNHAKNLIKKGCYNLNVRMNGREGYWEMVINHIEPLKSLPAELRFPVKRKKNRKGDGKQ